MTRSPGPADEVERGLLQALQIDGRVAFSLVADVLDVSERTVERRYRELRAAGAVRVVGKTWPSAVDEQQWLVRVGCVPDAAEGLAHAVARLPETSWVQLTSGGAELLTMVRVPAGDDQPSGSVLSRLPRSPRVTRVDGLSVLAVFAGGRISPLTKAGPLPDEAVRRIADAALPDDGQRCRPTDDDAALLAALEVDGRARWRDLATTTGRSPTTVRRRVAELVRGQALVFDVDFAPSLLGLRSSAALWLSVHPSDLLAAGEALAGHPEVGFAAATTGATNLYASVQLRDDRALFEYLTGPVTTLPGLIAIHTAPVLRTVKRTA
ncbi:Lrp/AsnC family transcriptional regulator [Actinomycetospora termitidis]|uniref:Lrp/AsnC family transcriptional regulator n=1 Tax=Actinomycetospora termitidis TaxID=3053470 RepID=A0ABT7MDX1_9PSEU|nr:Lrp/AsnC family transcriptional regulator [Actinomycetospora sp. Odt1-22]MDL5158860.1 Lrp/AsnC family transcriptional regulator [Actinomycetospora sp. Odt1-22]